MAKKILLGLACLFLAFLVWRFRPVSKYPGWGEAALAELGLAGRKPLMIVFGSPG